MIKRARLAILAALTLAHCSPVDVLNAVTPGVTVTKDIAYGSDPRQRLDIYSQAGSRSRPIVMFIYGGSWNSGSKSIYPFMAATLARQGNIVVVPDYRLYPQVKYPHFLQDCAAAFAWTVSHGASLHGDGRLFVMGHSAGAYNAAMLALDAPLLQTAGTSRDRITGFIGLAGPYDFLPIVDPEVIAVFGSRDNPATQPVTYVDAKAPPMLLLAGTADETVRPRNTTSLAAHATAAGGQAEAKLYPGIGHIGLILSIAPAFQWKAPVLADIQRFIASHPVQAANPVASSPAN